VFRISIWGRSFLRGALCRPDWILGPCDSVSPQLGVMECGWCGSALEQNKYGLIGPISFTFEKKYVKLTFPNNLSQDVSALLVTFRLALPFDDESRKTTLHFHQSRDCTMLFLGTWHFALVSSLHYSLCLWTVASV